MQFSFENHVDTAELKCPDHVQTTSTEKGNLSWLGVGPSKNCINMCEIIKQIVKDPL